MSVAPCLPTSPHIQLQVASGLPPQTASRFDMARNFGAGYSKDHDNRTPPLTFRTYQILPHTNSYFHCLYSYLDLLPQGPLGYPRGYYFL